MDYESHDTPSIPEAPVFQAPMYEPPRKKTSIWRILSTVLLILSIMANGILLLLIIGMAALMAGSGFSPTSGPSENIIESTLIDGGRQKIAAIRIEGIIDGQMSDWVKTQLEAAEEDPFVKGVIVRIISPGGGVSSSDQIHHYISRYKDRTGKPVLAFMQSVAASGGYYAAVACDEIMAEPTAITGSIGVMMSHLVLKELLEEKLGIDPVVLKSGERKDWPSPFSETTNEQKQYLDERIIQPAYERFVELVAAGRQERLTKEEVCILADGSIFTAPDALTNKLIDQIGYFEEAVDALADRASISNPTVVEYSKKISVFSMLGAEAQTGLKIDSRLLEKLLVPQLMYLWDGKQ